MGVTVPFLMYHRVAPAPASTSVPGHYVPPSRFKAHMHTLVKKGYQIRSLSQVADRWAQGQQAEANSLVLTFAVGYEHWDTYAMPVLRQMKLTAELFIVAGRMGGSNLWDNQKGDVIEIIADEKMVLRWATEGFSIGSHGLCHLNLADLGPEQLREELTESKQKLEEVLSGPVSWLCYPYGGQNEGVRAAAKEAGYRGACSTRKGINDEDTDPYQWRRINVRSDTWTPFLFWKIKREEKRHLGGP